MNYLNNNTRQLLLKMSQCYYQPTVNYCKIISFYLDVTNTTELIFNIVKDGIMLLLFVWITWRICRYKTWRDLDDQRKYVKLMYGMLITACLFYLVANVLQIILYKELYKNAKSLNQINFLKNVYLSFSRMVSLLINNNYILLCVIWQKILTRCNLSKTKTVFKIAGVIFFLYNSAVIVIYVLDVIYQTSPYRTIQIDEKYWTIISLILRGLSCLPAFLILYSIYRFNLKLYHLGNQFNKSNKSLWAKIIVLACVNIFRIGYQITVHITTIPKIGKLNMNEETKCCQRQEHPLGFPIFIFCVGCILTLTPIAILSIIFKKREESQLKSLISERSQISEVSQEY